MGPTLDGLIVEGWYADRYCRCGAALSLDGRPDGFSVVDGRALVRYRTRCPRYRWWLPLGVHTHAGLVVPPPPPTSEVSGVIPMRKRTS